MNALSVFHMTRTKSLCDIPSTYSGGLHVSFWLVGSGVTSAFSCAGNVWNFPVPKSGDARAMLKVREYIPWNP